LSAWYKKKLVQGDATERNSVHTSLAQQPLSAWYEAQDGRRMGGVQVLSKKVATLLLPLLHKKCTAESKPLVLDCYGPLCSS